MIYKYNIKIDLVHVSYVVVVFFNCLFSYIKVKNCIILLL